MKIKNTIVQLLLVSAFLVINTNVNAQQLKIPAASPLQTIDQAFGLSNIKIEYSRPSVKNRVIFGDLVPYGKIWRTGANATTKITFGDSVSVEGMGLKSGTYGLYTIPDKDNWVIMFYKDLDLGGDVGEYKTENEVLRVKVRPSQMTSKVETFTINIANVTSTSAVVEFAWENTRAAFNVTTDIDKKIMKNIESVVEKDSRPYAAAANYYYENNKDLNKALQWADLAIAANPKAYYTVHLKAKIYMKMKNYNSAIETAEKSKMIAIEEKADDYVRLNDKLIAEAKSSK